MASARGNNAQTTKIEEETFGGSSYKYTYDLNGNITSVLLKKSTESAYIKQQQFAYDELNQLVRADDLAKNCTEVYTYDNGGNILSTKAYPLTWGSLSGVTATDTTTYTYGDSNWKDKLTAYGDTPITYDAIGNPLTYRGYTLTWQNGRQLASLSGNGTTASYTYDVDGLRTSKTVNGVKHEYYYVGSRLQYEKYGTTELWFFYDADGTPSGIRYKNGDSINDYYFVCNWRGDVTEIYDSTGALAASCSYDAWGKVVSVKDASGAAITSSTHIANVNPIRYRGYYYDTETGLYYLKSRYYDPQVKRFLNADGYVQTGDGLYDKNMFAYCLNNPVNSSDPTGKFAWIVVGALVFIGMVGVAGGIIGYNSKSKLIDKPKTTQNSSNYKKQSNSNNNNNTSKTKSNTSKGKSNASKGKSSSSNRNVSRHQNRGSISHNTENNRLSSSDRAMNTFIGATLGIAVGGAAVALVGAGIAVIGGAVALGAQVAAIGCLAFNAEAIIFAPFYGIEMEPIDWDYGY